jgi:hypothetical protein
LIGQKISHYQIVEELGGGTRELFYTLAQASDHTGDFKSGDEIRLTL